MSGTEQQLDSSYYDHDYYYYYNSDGQENGGGNNDDEEEEDLWALDLLLDHRGTEEVHPVVEQTIVEGKKRRHSRVSFCLTGDFVLVEQDIWATLQYVDSSPLIHRMLFVQTVFTHKAVDVLARYLEGTLSLQQQRNKQSESMQFPATQPRIKKLIFSNVLMSDEMASRLLKGIAKNGSLCELVFHECCFDIDATMGRQLSSYVSQNPQLQCLNLTGSGSTEAGLFYFTCAAVKHMTELNLSDCDLDCAKVRVLFQGLTNGTAPCLRRLNLSHNDIRAQGLGYVAKFLVQHGNNDKNDQHGLQSLSLAQNRRLFDNAQEETAKLAQSLCVNFSLKRFILERCGLQGSTASLLFRALETNCTLEELNVQINSGIGITGYDCLIRSIPKYRVLRSLAFDALHHPPVPLDQRRLLAAIQQNTSLTKLQVRYGLDPDIQEQSNGALRRNRFRQIVRLSTDGADRYQRGLAAISLSQTLASTGATTIFNLFRSCPPKLFHGTSAYKKVDNNS